MTNDCISQSFKVWLLSMIEKKKPLDLIQTVIEDFMPTCESTGRGGATTVVAGAKIAPSRVGPTEWPGAVLHLSDGTTKAGTFSGLFKEEFGIPVTEDLVCRITKEEGKTCRPISTVEAWEYRGFIVKGDGEPTPKINPDMSDAQINTMYKKWKDNLISRGLKIHIFHPESPQRGMMPHELEE